MSRIATARKLATEIWTATEAMADSAERASFTATQSIGYPLAEAIVKGWVTGISPLGLMHLESTANDLAVLLMVKEAEAAEAAKRAVAEAKPVQLVRNGITWTLKIKARATMNQLAVIVGATVIDSAGDTFVITGAEWNPLMDEREPVLVGYWPSISQDESHAGGAHVSIFPDVRWTWLANN